MGLTWPASSFSRTTYHPNDQIRQKVRKRVEKVFGWMKTIGILSKGSRQRDQKAADPKGDDTEGVDPIPE